MKCPKCGNDLASNKKFCTKCGCNVEEYIKEQKEKSKQERSEKFYKIKKKIAIVLLLILLLGIVTLVILNTLGKKSHKPAKEYSIIQEEEQKEEEQPAAENGSILEFEVTEENKNEDYDRDGLRNGEEKEYGTSIVSADTDEDGLTDYEEINRYKSDPLKYDTAGDGISDYIKVKKDLDFNRKYTESEIKPETVEYSYKIKLKPDDLESQYYGGIEQYSMDPDVKSTYQVFNMIDFRGTVEYDTGTENSILLVRKGSKYTEFKNYKNESGKLIITITDDDNYKDFVITTKENYEKFQKGE